MALVGDIKQRSLWLFVDGSEESAASVPPEVASFNLNRQVIGRESDGKRPQRYFRGAIDDVRLYAQALDAGAIAALCP